ncbi:hypothetical protein [Variovorax paradoxus]|uniref:hypothetical protein n=1 Tax=Variovorax paradoxus TaxID=34073 RepID=UPI003D64C86C
MNHDAKILQSLFVPPAPNAQFDNRSPPGGSSSGSKAEMVASSILAMLPCAFEVSRRPQYKERSQRRILSDGEKVKDQ